MEKRHTIHIGALRPYCLYTVLYKCRVWLQKISFVSPYTFETNIICIEYSLSICKGLVIISIKVVEKRHTIHIGALRPYCLYTVLYKCRVWLQKISFVSPYTFETKIICNRLFSVDL